MAIVLLFFLICAVGSAFSSATANESKPSLEQQLSALLAQKAQHASDPDFLVRLADLYLDLGDEGYAEESKRRVSYEEGARIARQAIDLQERNAHAHYLYAANLGSAAQLKGVMASALTINELKGHAKRALELQPDHAPALHMMGMMLEELPWFLGGDRAGALDYLKRAVAADPGYAHARLDLAKAYIKRRDQDAARRELNSVLQQPLSIYSSEGDRRHREEAFKLLDSLAPPR